MKRLICFVMLLACLSVCVFALPDVHDGIIGPREYNETLSVLQVPKDESNNNLVRAYLSWVVSPKDHTVYLGVRYHCKDYNVKDGRTGVRVFVNDFEQPVGTIYADGTIECEDSDRYRLDGELDDGTWGSPYESFCELQIGILFWPEGEIKVGVQIIDFSGSTSNCYEQLVYSPYTTTTKPEETTTAKTTAEKTTKEKTTKETTTKETSATVRAADKTTASTAASTAERTVFHPAPAITASPTRETTTAVSTAAASVRAQTSDARTTKEPSEKTTKAETTKRQQTTAPPTTEMPTTAPKTEPTSAESNETALSATATTEPLESASYAVSGAQMYSELNKVKIVGTVLVAVILTAAIMSAVFLGMRRKEETDGSHTQQEEHDDFG